MSRIQKNETNGFYKKFTQLTSDIRENKPDLATPFKIEFLKELIPTGKVYKFIGLEDKANGKLTTLEENKIWCSYFSTLNDETEFDIQYDEDIVSESTGKSKQFIKFFIELLKEQYDVYSLSYRYENYMWKSYANNGNGICIEFNVEDYDYLFPVEYCNKRNNYFTDAVINTLHGNISSQCLAVIPWVLKNSYNETTQIDSTKEKEVRILSCPFEEGHKLEYIKLDPLIKNKLGYEGESVPIINYGLSISKVIIGERISEPDRKRVIEYCQKNKIQYE